jgi:hypothetical protein
MPGANAFSTLAAVLSVGVLLAYVNYFRVAENDPPRRSHASAWAVLLILSYAPY